MRFYYVITLDLQQMRVSKSIVFCIFTDML